MPRLSQLLLLLDGQRHRSVQPPHGGGGFIGGGGGAAAAGGGAAGAAGGSAAGAASAGGGSSSIYNAASWLFQPDSYQDLDKYGSVALPAIAASAAILTFKIPNGRMGKIVALGINVTANGGAAYVPDVQPFQLSFQLTSSSLATGWQDFANFDFVPGSVQSPMAIAGLTLVEGQTVTLAVTNLGLVKTTQWIGGHIQGYTYSKKQHPKGLGYQ